MVERVNRNGVIMLEVKWEVISCGTHHTSLSSWDNAQNNKTQWT